MLIKSDKNRNNVRENLAKHAPKFGPIQIAHFVVKTAQPEKLIEWYKQVFDAVEVFRDDKLTFLTYDRSEHHRIAILSMPKLLYHARIITKNYRKLFGVDHIAFTFESLTKLLNNFNRLKNAGIFPIWCVNHGVTTSMYYEDPDGNRFEFQVDNFESLEEVGNWFETGVFEKNPIGVNYDPDYLLKKLEAGVPEKELMKQEAGVRPGQKKISGFKAINWRTI